MDNCECIVAFVSKNLQFVGGVTLGHFHPFCFHFLNNANLQRDITYVGGEINKVSHFVKCGVP